MDIRVKDIIIIQLKINVYRWVYNYKVGCKY